MDYVQDSKYASTFRQKIPENLTIFYSDVRFYLISNNE